jgi:hypothetical protein
MALAVLLAWGGAGCAVWYPHSLVASDRPIREAVLTGERVHDRVCGGYFAGLLLTDTRGSIQELMEQFHALAPQAIAFQDLRFDEVVSWYVVYTKRCLDGSAQPVLPVPVIPSRSTAVSPAPQAPSAPARIPISPDQQLEQELLGPRATSPPEQPH